MSDFKKCSDRALISYKTDILGDLIDLFRRPLFSILIARCRCCTSWMCQQLSWMAFTHNWKDDFCAFRSTSDSWYTRTGWQRKGSDPKKILHLFQLVLTSLMADYKQNFFIKQLKFLVWSHKHNLFSDQTTINGHWGYSHK